MEAGKQKHNNIDSLDILSEEKPDYLVQNFDAIKAQFIGEIQESRVSYFLTKALTSLRKFEQAELLAIDLLSQAVIHKDYYILVRCNIILSKCYDTRETLYKVKPCLELAEEYARASEDLELIVEAYSQMGSHLHKYDYDKQAIECHNKAVVLVKNTRPGLTTVNALTRIAKMYLDKQDFLKVIDYLSQALEISRKVGIGFIQLSIINNLATAYNKLQKYVQAEELLEKALDTCRSQKLSRQELSILFNLGVQKNYQLQFQAAIDYYDQCSHLAQDLNFSNPAFLTDLYNNYANCYWLLKQPDKSIEYLNRAEEVARQANNTALSIQINVNKTNILIETGQYSEAKDILISAGKYYKANKNYANLLVVQRNLALLFARQEDYKKSFKTYQVTDKIYMDYIAQLLSEKADSHKLQLDELRSRCAQPISSIFDDCSQSQLSGTAEFIGQSDTHKKVLNSALLAAQHMNTNVFIIGESGTGKEVIANIIHQNSIRRSYPFVPLNTSAISAGIVESELFGHTKGAFTGAQNQTKGFFIQAHKGTLFLDEITEMPHDFQAKLLRVLESRKITPVGSSIEIPFDCRVISSTNRNIYDLLQTNEFRMDLFHRLNTIEIFIPPLRERPEDIEILLHYFVDKYSFVNKHSIPHIDRSFIDRLLKYPFPGNVRELKNIVERLFIMSGTSVWNDRVLDSLKYSSYDTVHSAYAYKQTKAEETEMIINALLHTNGKQKDAATRLKMTESTLCRKIAKYHLESYTHKGK